MKQAIGKITSVHGLKGEVTFNHHLEGNTDFTKWDCFLIELNPNSFIPYFIESIKPISDEACICKLEEVTNRDEAKLIVGKNIYSSPNYSIEVMLSDSYERYLNFSLFDNDNHVGKIIDVVSMGASTTFVIEKDDTEILIPVHTDLIVKSDDENKIIIMKLPAGLLDL